MASFVYEHGRQGMPSSINFSMTLKTETLSTEFSNFLKQIIFIKSFNSVFHMEMNFRLLYRSSQTVKTLYDSYECEAC